VEVLKRSSARKSPRAICCMFRRNGRRGEASSSVLALRSKRECYFSHGGWFTDDSVDIMRYEYASSYRPIKIRVIFVVFVYLVAANIPLWIASRSIGLLLIGVFNAEFLIIGVLSVFLRRRLTVGLLLVAIFLDIVRGIGSTYLLSPSEMLRSARYLFGAGPSHLWHATMIAICIAVTCLLAVFASSDDANGQERGYVISTFLVLSLICGVVDVVTGHTILFRRDAQLNIPRLTRFPIHFLVMSELQHEAYRTARSTGVDASALSASTRLVELDTTAEPPGTSAMLPNVVLILVESWGKLRAADLDEILVQPYEDAHLSARYTVSQGTVPFHGSTIAGEARELCGSSMGFGLLAASASQLKGCLPARMNGVGYHSVGVHGFSDRMFDRGEWYRRIGFNETWFKEGLQQSGLPLCPGPFPGICDAAASVWIGDQLQRNSDSPRFIYWVTLNSHLPVPIPNKVLSPPTCEDKRPTAESPALCSWYQLEFNVHRSVAALALRETVRPTVFLIVGDHAPPFASAKLRNQFSDQVVPYVLLVPKRSAEAHSVMVATHSPAGMRAPHFKNVRNLIAASGGQ
jgi:phosphoglycerol transferase MdoB-like AlkP superfamily enzyme